MVDLGFAVIRFIQLHIVVDLKSEIRVVLHGSVGLLDNVVAGGTYGNQSSIAGLSECADRGELGRDLIFCHRESAAAALPVIQLSQGDAQCLSGSSGVFIQIFGLGFQRAAGVIMKYHIL